MKNIYDDKSHPKPTQKKYLLKAIREKCLDCCVGQHSEVRNCQIKECSLWHFRMGKNPFHKRSMTENQKEEATKRLR